MGTTLIPIEFDNIDYSDGIYHGFFEVEQNGKLGLFDKNGNNIVPCQYDNVQLNQTGYRLGFLLYAKMINMVVSLMAKKEYLVIIIVL